MANKLKIGFIGGGINSVVGNTHRIASQMDNRWELVAGCFSKDQNINHQTGLLWSVKNVYDDWQLLLENEKNNLDAVSVLTPTNLHFEMVKKAIEMGYSVICEKTLTSIFSEANIISNIAKENNSFVAVINNYTGYPMLRELKEMIKLNKLGKIHHIQVEMPQEGFIRYANNNKPKPQSWRLKDYQIPTIYLDLAIHLHHIVSFLIKNKPLEVCAAHQSYGFFNDIIDNATCMANYSDNVSCQIWFSKSALGSRNGLKIRLYGDIGSAEWLQMESEYIKFCDKQGRIEIIDRASPNIIIANQDRYNRFKAGHPAGFIEAFANYYYDLADAVLDFQKNKIIENKWIVTSDLAKEAMGMLDSMALSVKNKTWKNVQQ